MGNRLLVELSVNPGTSFRGHATDARREWIPESGIRSGTIREFGSRKFWHPGLTGVNCR
jgi:hypothetical protein